MQDDFQVKAASATLKRMAFDPISWIPFLPFAAAYSFLGTPWWACATGAALAGAGVIAWWRRHWSALYESTGVALLKEQSATDNQRLQQAITDLSQRLGAGGDPKLARSLPTFLTHKRHIDTAIFEDNRVSPVEAEIAGMIADLSHAWLADLGRLADGTLSDAENQRLRHAAVKGLAVIERTSNEIDTLIRPSHGLDPVIESAATDRAQRLEDRIDEARNIRDRLVRDLKSEDIVPNQEGGKLTQ